MTSGLPFDDFRALLKALPGPDHEAKARAAAKTARLSAQGPAVGRLGAIAEWLAAWSGREPQVVRPLAALFAGTHGVAPDATERTRAMVEHCAAGGAMISQLCAANDLGLKIFDLALHLPVADIAREPALDERGCAATMAFGMEAVAGGIDLLCLGAVGTGGATAVVALMAALHGGSAGDWALPAADIAAAGRALSLHGDHLHDPLEALRRLGGREFAAIAGAILAARMQKVPVILDGSVSLAAASVLRAAAPAALDHCILAQKQADAPWQEKAAARLGLMPLLDLGLGDGEAAGAALAAALVRNAAAVHSGMVCSEIEERP